MVETIKVKPINTLEGLTSLEQVHLVINKMSLTSLNGNQEFTKLVNSRKIKVVDLTTKSLESLLRARKSYEKRKKGAAPSRKDVDPSYNEMTAAQLSAEIDAIHAKLKEIGIAGGGAVLCDADSNMHIKTKNASQLLKAYNSIEKTRDSKNKSLAKYIKTARKLLDKKQYKGAIKNLTKVDWNGLEVSQERDALCGDLNQVLKEKIQDANNDRNALNGLKSAFKGLPNAQDMLDKAIASIPDPNQPMG